MRTINFAGVWAAVFAWAATVLGADVAISGLPVITAPSTNTFIEVADMDAATKSRKYLLTNLVTQAQLNAKAITNYFIGNGGGLTITTNVSGTNVSWTLTGTGGASVWTNDSGVIAPSDGQTTNVLRFTSGLADNATNVAMVVDTADTWTQGNGIQQRNQGTNVFWTTSSGAVRAGRGASYFAPNNGDILSAVSDAATAGVNYNNTYIGIIDDANSPTNLAYLQLTTGTDPYQTATFYAMTDTWEESWQLGVQGDDFSDFLFESRFAFDKYPLWFRPNYNGSTGFPSNPLNDVAYKMDTSQVVTNNNLLTVGNAGTNKFTVAYDGSITTEGSVTANGAGDSTFGTSIQVAQTNFANYAIFTNSVSAGTVLCSTGTVAGALVAITNTVSSLPASGALGEQRYVSDALTPWGTGDRVEWNGTNWRTLRSRIIATASLPQYMLYALEAAWTGNTPIQLGRHADSFGSRSSSLFVQDGWLSGGAGAAGTLGAGAVAGRSYFDVDTSTSATGQADVFGGTWLPTSGDTVQFGVDVLLSAVSSDTEEYSCYVGFTSSVNAIGTDAAIFFYDRTNSLAYLPAGSTTNNWWCASRVGSSTITTNDTGVAASSSAWTRFVVQKAAGYDAFFVNGTLVASNVVSSSTMLYPRISITKSAGTTSRRLNYDWANYQIRYNTARTFYP